MLLWRVRRVVDGLVSRSRALGSARRLLLLLLHRGVAARLLRGLLLLLLLLQVLVLLAAADQEESEQGDQGNPANAAYDTTYDGTRVGRGSSTGSGRRGNTRARGCSIGLVGSRCCRRIGWPCRRGILIVGVGGPCPCPGVRSRACVRVRACSCVRIQSDFDRSESSPIGLTIPGSVRALNLGVANRITVIVYNAVEERNRATVWISCAQAGQVLAKHERNWPGVTGKHHLTVNVSCRQP